MKNNNYIKAPKFSKDSLECNNPNNLNNNFGNKPSFNFAPFSEDKKKIDSN
jgi:hypothetical protein